MTDLTTEQMILIEQRVAADAKSAGVAYALWFFLGIFSAHRFYLRRPISALCQIASYFIIVGFLWWLLDLILIPAMVDNDKEMQRWQMKRQMLAANKRALG